MAIAQTNNNVYTTHLIFRSWLHRDREQALGYFSDQGEDVQSVPRLALPWRSLPFGPWHRHFIP